MGSNYKEEVKYRAYKFSIKIVKFVTDLPNQRIYAASSKKDFINFYAIALKSANETLYWLGVLRDATQVNKEELNSLLVEAKSLANILGVSLLTLKGKRKL